MRSTHRAELRRLPLSRLVLSLAASSGLLGTSVQAQASPNGGGGRVGLPVDGPRIPRPRLQQSDIVAGTFDLDELRRKGLEIFTLPFNKADGHGDGPVDFNDPSSFGGRPTTNGTWLRVNGLDSQTCLECHQFTSNATVPATLGIGGIAGIASSAFPGVTEFDLGDLDLSGIAEVNGRLINPPFLFGSGGVELAGKEMTSDLQALKAQAQANPGTAVPLVSKGVRFGTVSYDAVSGFDTSNVEGIDEDLVVRPFGRKGEFSSVRQFDIGALQFHMGMQTEEDVGTNVDADGDGVVNEITIGELSALHIFNVSLERPVQVAKNSKQVKRGARTFSSVGCASCHVPVLETSSPLLTLSFPEVQDDPDQNVFFTIDLENGPAGFRANGQGGVSVPLFSDLKRHDMGPDLAETTGSPLDPFFITPRLWGISDTAPYLHDGRALTLREAIEMHGGEGQFAADNFALLTAAEQDELLIFLNSLRTPRNAAKDISKPKRM